MTPWEHARRLLPLKDVDEAELLDRLLTKRAQLWVSPEGAGVTEVTDSNMCHVWLAGGSLSGLLAMLADVEAFARAMGCTGLELSGRKGWRRVMMKYGFVWNGQEMVKAF